MSIYAKQPKAYMIIYAICHLAYMRIYAIIKPVKGNKRKQFRHRQKMGEEHLQELGRNSKVQQGSRDQLKAPSRRSSPRQRKSAPEAVESKPEAQPKRAACSIAQPAEKGKGLYK